MHALRVSAAAVLVAGFATVAAAETPIALTISGNTASGHVDLPGGLGVDLTLSFETASGLNPTAIDASASIINPLDLALLARLPAVGAAIPLEFPVMIRVDPSASSELSFRGVMSVALHTGSLDLRADLPLALYSAHAGGPFADVSHSESSGSYRVVGSKGGMSEFVIVVDTRLIDTVINGKFGALQTLLNQNAASMPPSVLSGLTGRLTAAGGLFDSGQTAAARDEVARFESDVLAQSGVAIPDVWRARDTLVDVAGLLRSGAHTLSFSLSRKLAGSP